MPIEFRCPSCSKLLRTPDESAGKKAKCPQCGTIADVPLSSSGPNVPGPTPLAPISPAPSTEGPVLPPPKPEVSNTSGASNPYASSSLYEMPFAPTMATGGGELAPTRMSFDNVLNKTWELFSPQMGPMALAGLTIFGIYFALQAASVATRLAAEQTREPVIVVSVVVINTVLGIVYQLWVQTGMANLTLKYVRGSQPRVSDLFSVGPYLFRVVVLFVLYMFLILIPMSVLALPGGVALIAQQQEVAIGLFIAGGVFWLAWIFYLVVTFFYMTLPICFIIDRQMTVMESLRESRRFMKGNKLTAFLLMLVTGIVGGLFMCVTCSIGQILYIPYQSLLATVVYLTITGQPVYTSSGIPKS